MFDKSYSDSGSLKRQHLTPSGRCFLFLGHFLKTQFFYIYPPNNSKKQRFFEQLATEIKLFPLNDCFPIDPNQLDMTTFYYTMYQVKEPQIILCAKSTCCKETKEMFTFECLEMLTLASCSMHLICTFYGQYLAHTINQIFLSCWSGLYLQVMNAYCTFMLHR